jgi:F-type H+-transporting ATPase subunit epsilon
VSAGATFMLTLVSPVRREQLDDVLRFTGRDGSGSFGILANAFRRITALSFGMASLTRADGASEYLALPGGVLYFSRNSLRIATTAFVRSRSMDEVAQALEKKIRSEEEGIREIRRSLHRLDEEILKRLSHFSRGGGR